MSEAVSGGTLTRQRLALIGIVLLFASPIVAAWVMWQYAQHHHRLSTLNHGDLVTPARPVTNLSLRDLAGKPFTLKDLRGKWTLVYLGTAACEATCREALYTMRQARLAQGAEMNRVARLYILAPNYPQGHPRGHEAPTPEQSLKRALEEFAGTTVVTGDSGALAPVRAQLRAAAGNKGGAENGDQIFLIDPLGNIMMRYPPGSPGPGLVKDLERLLRVSQIG